MEPYNSLKDPHLSGYFSNENKKKHIINAGLMSKEGELISESEYKLNAIMAEKKLQTDDKLRRRYKILPRVNMPSEDFCKETRVPPKFMSAGVNRRKTFSFSSPDRIKSAPDYFKGLNNMSRQLKPYSKSFLPPHPFSYKQPMMSLSKHRPLGSFSSTCHPSRSDFIKLQISADKQEYSGVVTCKSLPLIKGGEEMGLKLKLSGTLKLLSGKNQSTEMRHKTCMVTMRYHGDSLKLLNRWCARVDEVVVEQQLAGGGALVVFKEMLPPGSTFSFESRRTSSQPFSLTLYVNRCMNCRISVCCEGRHRKGGRLGGANGLFSLVHVQNPAYCPSCFEKRYERLQRKKLKKKKTYNGEMKDKEYNSNDEASIRTEDERRRSKMSDDVDTEVKHRHRSMKKVKKENKDGDYSSDYEQDSSEEQNVKHVHKKKKKDKKKPKSGRKLSKIKLNGLERSIDSANKSGKSIRNSIELDSKSAAMVKNAIDNIEAFQKNDNNNDQNEINAHSLKGNKEEINCEGKVNAEVNDEKKEARDSIETNNNNQANYDVEKMDQEAYEETINDLTYILIKSVYRGIEREEGNHDNNTDDFSSEDEE